MPSVTLNITDTFQSAYAEGKHDIGKADICRDSNILKCLPGESVITDLTPCGTSGWTCTTRLQTALPDGTAKSYFMKTCSADFAAVMMEGESQSMSLIYKHIPSSCPKPLGWGECSTNPGTFFLVMEFLDLGRGNDADDSDEDDKSHKYPAPKCISKVMADLHRRSSWPLSSPPSSSTPLSPPSSPASPPPPESHQFGFAIPNCHGAIVRPNKWDTDWSRYFTDLISVYHQADIQTNGPPDREYQQAYETLRQHVIPRLLRPLQADGRVLRPCLVHGDLWVGNMGLDKTTGQPMVYDACSSVWK